MATATITAATVTGTAQRTIVQSVSEKRFKGWGAGDFRPELMAGNGSIEGGRVRARETRGQQPLGPGSPAGRPGRTPRIP
jgi:hypothetical protein